MVSNEEYQILLNQINILTERRQTVTTTYLSVTTAITAAIAFLFKDGQLAGWIQQLSVLVLLFAGLAACALWRRLITQYSTVLNWWYIQLRALENTLPANSKIISKEYQDLYLNKEGKPTIGLTRYESRLTWLFTLVYFIFGCAIAISLILK